MEETHERSCGDREGGELQPEAGEAEIDKEDLDQKRRVADRLDINAADARNDRVAAPPPNGTENTDDRTQHGRDEGELEGEQRSLQEGWPSLKDRGEIQVEVHLR